MTISAKLEALEPRERILIYVAGALLLLFCLWQFLIAPVIDARTTSAQQQATALRDYAIVQNGLGALSRSVTPVDRRPFDRAAITDTAQSFKLTLSRLQPDQGGQYKIWLEDAPSGQVYQFVQVLTQRYAVKIARAQMSRRDNGLVSAQLTLAPSSLASGQS